MKNTFLKISKPCQERWENMIPTEKGSFCAVCSKNVIDFTRLSTEEISAKMNASKRGLCARATPTQLKMPLVPDAIPKEL